MSTTSSPRRAPAQSALTLDGRHYIDTSDDSASTTDPERTRSPDQTVSFVAADLNERVRLTSAADSPSHSSASSSSPGTAPIDSAATISKIENDARQISAQMHEVVHRLSKRLAEMNTLTLEHAKVFNSTVHDTCDQVDQCIKNTYQLMAKFEELSLCAQQMPRLAQNMFRFNLKNAQMFLSFSKEIKRTLDMYEAHLKIR